MAMPVKSVDLDRWAPEANALPADLVTYNVPFGVLLDEAVEAANKVNQYWDPVADGPSPRPGLSQVAGRGVARGLRADAGEALLSLQRAAADADANFRFVAKLDESPAPRARQVLRELHAALAFVFDDGVADDSDRRLAALEDAQRAATSHADLALALDGYANLAALHRADLASLGTFDAGMIDEARPLAEELRRRPAHPNAHTPETRAALDARERYAALIHQRLTALRAAARFVFRDHPAIAREFTSSYERRKRAAARRAEEKAKAAEPAKA